MKNTSKALVLSVLALGSSPAFAQQNPWSTGPFACYAVPAMSSSMRLPDQLPEDGVLSGEIRVVATQGEFEPASFVIAPRSDVAKLELKAESLRGPGGEIPAANVDIKVVKTWYQAGTAWYSYFADSNRRELVPELLLNDETLVKVDEKAQENYLRVGGKYEWISYPSAKAEKAFNYLTEPVADAATLQPVQLEKNRNKQIWVTVKVPANLAGGIYRGRIQFVADGRPAGAMQLAVKVLPFALPDPKTYYDLRNEFIVTLYSTDFLGMASRLKLPQADADRLQAAVYKNLIDHNVVNIMVSTSAVGKDRTAALSLLKHEIELMKESGASMKPLLTRGWGYYGGTDEEKDVNLFKSRIDELAQVLKEEAGHDDIYITSWDEAGTERVKKMRELAEYVDSKGLKMWMTTAEGRHFNLAGYVVDFANHGGWPEKDKTEAWHAIGSKVGSYAGPHTGPENPNVFRLYEGLARYKANYDASFNYKYFSAFNPSVYERLKSNPWNDFTNGAFRCFNLIYPTQYDVIDTLAWEGFREGIDDIRYATKLKQDADKAIHSGNVPAMHEAKKALIWLELLDEHKADLNAVRLEMIDYILRIQKAMGN